MTISPTLEAKIERRARLAWRRRSEGDDKRKFHRIRNIKDDELEYRVPYSPDYYGSEWVRVVLRDDNSVDVDPPTTGMIDLKKQEDLKRIEKHIGVLRAYIRIKPNGKQLQVGDVIDSQYQVKARRQISKEVTREDRVVVVEAHADDVNEVKYGHITLDRLTVVDELDLVKDLQFTTGILDLLVKADVEALRDNKKHLGTVRAYKYTDKNGKSPIHSTGKLTYKVGEDYEVKNANTSPGTDCGAGINLADLGWAKKNAHGSHRVFAFELEMDDIAAIPTGTDGKFRVHRCKCVAEIDPQTGKEIKALPGPAADGEDPKKKGFFGKLFGSEEEEED